MDEAIRRVLNRGPIVERSLVASLLGM